MTHDFDAGRASELTARIDRLEDTLDRIRALVTGEVSGPDGERDQVQRAREEILRLIDDVGL